MSAIITVLSNTKDPRLQDTIHLQKLVFYPLSCENAFAAILHLVASKEVLPLEILSREIVQGLLKYLKTEGEINRHDRLRFFLRYLFKYIQL